MPPSTSTADEIARSSWTKGRASHLLKPPELRAPDWIDGVIFFLILPAGVAFVFSLVGVRLINGMPYWQGLGYMLIHMAIAWWSVAIGASLVKLTFRSWRPPVIAICTLGFFLALIPAGFLYQRLGDYYASISEIFAYNRADNAMPSWHWEYFVHFVRYSIPALPLFLAGVFGYRFATGVKWFGYPLEVSFASPDAVDSAPAPQPKSAAVAGLIEGTQLPQTAVLLAIKAEQHYIKIWSDQGNDLVRYRFMDLDKALADCNGLQVHRSWWVNLDQVRKVRHAHRKLEIVMNETLSIPVSNSYKQVLFARLGKKIGPEIESSPVDPAVSG